MKIMRYRIRMGAFLLVFALLLLLFLNLRTAIFSPQDSPEASAAPIPSLSPSAVPEETPSADTVPTAEPLFDTHGL